MCLDEASFGLAFVEPPQKLKPQQVVVVVVAVGLLVLYLGLALCPVEHAFALPCLLPPGPCLLHRFHLFMISISRFYSPKIVVVVVGVGVVVVVVVVVGVGVDDGVCVCVGVNVGIVVFVVVVNTTSNVHAGDFCWRRLVRSGPSSFPETGPQATTTA